MNSIPRKHILLAVLSGLMLTASFPPFRLEWIAWFALVPLLKGVFESGSSRAFKLGLIAGLIHYLSLLYWVIVVLQHYGGLHMAVAVSALVLLSLYLALYPAVFSCLWGFMHKARFPILSMAAAWVALEFIRERALSGFPWCLLGYTQFRHPGLIQIADLLGVYGMSFLLVLSNGIIAALIFGRARLQAGRLRWEVLIAVAALAVTLFYGYGRGVDQKTEATGRTPVKVAIVQGNIDQSIKWDPSNQEETLRIYHELNLSTKNSEPDWVVWPETAVPFFFEREGRLTQQVRAIAQDTGTYLLFGSPAYENEDGVIRYYNRAYLLSPGGAVAGYYDKVHLVPFGEYVPFRGLIPFVDRVVQAVGDFEAGKKTDPLDTPGAPSGILICFEVIFPELARKRVLDGAEVLVNLTNDAWFGRTSAPYQHLSMAVFRAVENNRPLIRAANTGISAFIDAGGEIVGRSGLFVEEAIVDNVVPGGSALTFYTRYGYLFPYALFAITLMKISLALYYNRFKKAGTGPRPRPALEQKGRPSAER